MASNSSEIGADMQSTTLPVVATDFTNRIIDITRRVFGVPVAVKSSRDPEFPDEESTVFIVEPAGDIEYLIELECEWIRQVAAISPGLAPFRLSILPRQ